MSILFIGPYRQPDEWGKRSFNILQSLKKTNLDITSRPLFLASFPSVAVQEETEYTKFDNYDILIQHSLPMHFVADTRFKKNIGVVDLETLDIEHSGWLYKINFLDEIWVNSSAARDYLVEKFPDTTVRYVPNSLDIDVVKNAVQPEPSPSLDPNRFKFYFVGSAEAKNGIEELIIAYYRSFTSQDQVQLILCFPGVAPESFQDLFKRCVQKAGRLYEEAITPLVHIINVPFDAEQLTSIHMQCDCMVSPSYTFAAQHIPIQAAAFGNTPIITNGTGTSELLTDKNAWLIDSYDECCDIPERPFPDVFTAKETIRKPIIKSLSRCLLAAYQNKYLRDQKKSNTNALLEQVSYEEVGKQLKDYLCIQ